MKLNSGSPMLLLMRHAKSSWDQEGLPDRDRPLKKRGWRDAPRMAQFLASQQLTPDRIISSSALRARQTAEAVAEELRLPLPEIDPRLYEADLETWRQVLAELPRGPKILVVGHNPGLEDVLGAVTDGRVRMPTGAVAALRLRPDSMFLTLESLELVNVWRPKEL